MTITMNLSKQVIVNMDRGTYTFVTAQKGQNISVPEDVGRRMIDEGNARRA